MRCSWSALPHPRPRPRAGGESLAGLRPRIAGWGGGRASGLNLAPSLHPPPSYEAQRQTVCLLNCDRGDPRNSRTGPAQRIFARRLHPHTQSISISFSLSLPAAGETTALSKPLHFFSFFLRDNLIDDPPPPRPTLCSCKSCGGRRRSTPRRTSSVRGERATGASPKPNTTKPQRASPSLSESGRKKTQQGKGLAWWPSWLERARERRGPEMDETLVDIGNLLVGGLRPKNATGRTSLPISLRNLTCSSGRPSYLAAHPLKCMPLVEFQVRTCRA